MIPPCAFVFSFWIYCEPNVVPELLRVLYIFPFLFTSSLFPYVATSGANLPFEKFLSAL